ncbi:hypothetical protein GH714_031913 [Hevea brasiliensis]|uniref:XRRM domain-containing protein n=1 Tax=Hevea brasiliensis TaxID=3981 RepID=A0A6A6LW31_HEVBR|nr:hypothetical protein GH714_031913 [Hevea brasiliensis]
MEKKFLQLVTRSWSGFCAFCIALTPRHFFPSLVKFVDFKIGEDSGYVRFEQPEAAQKARATAVLAKEGGLIVKNFIAILEPVTGEAD